jgi:hypothetical protein
MIDGKLDGEDLICGMSDVIQFLIAQSRELIRPNQPPTRLFFLGEIRVGAEGGVKMTSEKRERRD